MYEAKLQQLGLTEGEAKVYVALLSIGSSTVGPIVKKSGVAYSNIYEILNRLIGKGFVSFIFKEKTKYFQAEEPTRIREYLNKQEEDLHRSRQTFEKVLPELEKLKAFVGEKEEAGVFMGEKGLLTAFERLMKGSTKKDQGLFFYVHDPKNYEKAEKFYMKSWLLIKRFGNMWKGISNDELRKTNLVKQYPAFIKQRYVPFPVPGNIDIMNDKVLLTVWRDRPIGILIHSQEAADSFKQYFDSVWTLAKP
ncbi:TrmB family transcriptional regulator [Candidatus Woesearchaeota archaeon]|nr:TrmB family transcriptional regulator [Candidatus Woesearchaeota archaeon]